jgi:F0F1-type ATP synthase alpha subunit
MPLMIRTDAPLGRQYGTLCSALAIAERQRDAGAHTLVVLDDISCMVRCHMAHALAIVRLESAHV